MQKIVKKINLLLGAVFVITMCMACGEKTDNSNEVMNKEENVTELESTIYNVYGNTIGNINTRGWLSKQGEWIYYNNDKGLYKIKSDGTERTQICLDDADYINIVGENLYYECQGLKKIDLSISEEEEDISNGWVSELLDESCSKIMVVEDKIYYLSSPGDYDWYIYKINTDGTGKEQLTNLEHGADSINVIGEWIYFAYGENVEMNEEEQGIYKVKTDGTMLQQISNDIVSEIIVADGYIYFYSRRSHVDEGMGIYKMKTDGTDKQKIFSTAEYGEFDVETNYKEELFELGQYIYFFDDQFSDGMICYRIKNDGSELQEIATIKDVYLTDIAIIDEHIYYKTEMGVFQMNADGTGLMQIE